MERRLYRKTSDKIIGGVCAGLADYVGVSKGGLRFLTLLAVMASGIFPGIFLYLLCVMLIPKEDMSKYNSDIPPNGQYQQYSNQQWSGENHWSRPRPEQERPFYPPPGATQTTPDHEAAPVKSGNRLLGFILVLLGAGVIARTYLTWIDPRYLFAGGLILFGLVLLFRKHGDV